MGRWKAGSGWVSGRVVAVDGCAWREAGGGGAGGGTRILCRVADRGKLKRVQETGG